MSKRPSQRTFGSSIGRFRRDPGATLGVAAVLACLATPGAAQAAAFDTSEASFDTSYAATPIDATGLVVDRAGAAVSGAVITAIGWGAGASNHGSSTATSATGAFDLAGLGRRSVLLKVEHPGYYTEIVAVDLHRSVGEAEADAGTITLTQKKPGRARLIFGGDTMFGRRFVDSDQDGVEGEAGDLIRPAYRAQDAKAILRYLASTLSAADYTQVNLESVATANPGTAHPYKLFTFFSYPETLQALTYAGVDGVSLGNNHMYDYLDPGVDDTLDAVSNAGLDWFGANLNETMARGSVTYRTIGGGVDISLQGFSQLVNDGTTDASYSLVARDSPLKGGALEVSSTNLTGFMSEEAADRLAIPVIHGGVEYSDYPTSGMRTRFVQSAQGGAPVVVAHHPHKVHGVGVVNTADGPSYVLMSLGNLVFDQEVFETFQSYVAVVDVDEAAPGSYAVHRVQLVPFHIEGYVPKLVSGEWLARAGRNVGHLSTTLPAAADGLTGAVVFPAGGRIVAVSDPSQYTTTDVVATTTAPISNKATPVLEYQRLDPADMLAHVQTSAPMSCEAGRELGIYGDFEDLDVDDAFSEGSFWSQSSVRYVENSVVHSGTGAAVFIRSASSTVPASMWMNNRVKFTPGKKLTVRGFLKGNNAGQFQVQVYWYTESGTSISNTYAYTRAAGTYGWEPFSINLTPPSNAGSIRAYFRASAPASGEANTFLDDVALIQWDASVADASTGWALAAPNAWSFLRCSTASTGLSNVNVTMKHRLFELAPSLP